MIEFDCSGCGTRLRVEDTLAGRKGKCPKCAAVIDVPASPDSNLTPQAPPVARVVPAPLPPASTATGFDNPFAEPTPEQKLRDAVRQALVDGRITDAEKASLRRTCEELGIPSTEASRIFREETDAYRHRTQTATPVTKRPSVAYSAGASPSVTAGDGSVVKAEIDASVHSEVHGDVIQGNKVSNTTVFQSANVRDLLENADRAFAMKNVSRLNELAENLPDDFQALRHLYLGSLGLLHELRSQILRSKIHGALDEVHDSEIAEIRVLADLCARILSTIRGKGLRGQASDAQIQEIETHSRRAGELADTFEEIKAAKFAGAFMTVGAAPALLVGVMFLLGPAGETKMTIATRVIGTTVCLGLGLTLFLAGRRKAARCKRLFKEQFS